MRKFKLGTGNLKSGGCDAMWAYGGREHDLCECLAARTSNTAKHFLHIHGGFPESSSKLQSAGSGYDFFPWRCGFATALCRADADNLFDLRASEDSKRALLFAALLRIRESFRNTVQSVCRMYTFSLLIII